MEYKIFGEDLPAVSVRLNVGESLYTQSGGMAWMNEGIQMRIRLISVKKVLFYVERKA